MNGRRSYAHAERNVRRLRTEFGGRRAVDIDADRVRTYTDRRLDQGAKPATINRELAALKRMFTLAVSSRKGFRYRPYIPLLAEDNAREGFLEPTDFEVLRSHLTADLADVATFAYLTGGAKVRSWARVARRHPRSHPGGSHPGGDHSPSRAASKNKRPRVVALRGALLALMERRVAARQLDCLRVFHRAGRRVPVRKAWAAACTAAGCAGLLFHDLRPSAVRNMVRAGVPERVAMRISGHRTRSVFDRYDITSEADIEAAAEQTSRYVTEKCTDAPRVVALTTGRSQVSDNLSDSSSVRTERAITSR